jgi:hypothetical protein
MTVKNLAGSTQTKTSVMSSMTEVTPDANKVYRFDGGAELYNAFTAEGVAAVEAQRAIAFVPGRLYTKSEIDRQFPTAVLDSITPSTLAAAGGTAVTIKGQNLTGVTAVQIEGPVAFTALVVVDENTITATSPAKSAGTWDILLVDDAGTVTKTDAVVTA